MTVKLGRGLTGNAIKLIAAVFMVIDHVGLMFGQQRGLFPDGVNLAMRALGRIALPLFAFMVAEGCRYTKNKLNYLISLFSVGMVCTLAYYVAEEGIIYLSIMTTFFFSALMIFAYQKALDAVKEKNGGTAFAYFALTVAVPCVAYMADKFAEGTGGALDYGVIGVLLPFSAYLFKNRWLRLIPFTLCLALSFLSPIYVNFPLPVQWVGMAAIPLLALYGGERGKLKLKYFFYLFYPLHLALLEGIAMLVV